MKKKSKLHGVRKSIHIISTGQQSMETFVRIISEIHNHVDAIHIREKGWTAKELVYVIQILVTKGVPLEKIMVNDRVDVAYSMKTGGVQLGYRSIDVSLVKKAFPSLLIGSSVHTVNEAIEAQRKGADYLLYGHIYPTLSKRGQEPKGLRNLREVIRNVSLPVIAIGGITPKNTKEILATGAKGIAVLSGVLLAKDPVQAVVDYQKAMHIEEVIS